MGSIYGRREVNRYESHDDNAHAGMGSIYGRREVNQYESHDDDNAHAGVGLSC